MRPQPLTIAPGTDIHKLGHDLENHDIVIFDHTSLDPTLGILNACRKDPTLKPLLITLANSGFSLYKTENNISRFIRNSKIPEFWHRVKNGEFKHHDNLIYSIEQPTYTPSKKLLVIFSSIGEDIFTPSLMRLFTFNFKSIAKYIPPDTTVLRIADIGSVVGGFYLDSNSDTTFASRVQKLIAKICLEFDFPHDSVVLYGASKGGTAALYHGVTGNYKSVIVDPIVSDEYYEKKYNDTHFTCGTFPKTKQAVFTELLSQADNTNNNITIIYSERSPQYKYISEIVRNSPTGKTLSYIKSENLLINDHPDVGPHTINITVMLINMALYNLTPPRFDLADI